MFNPPQPTREERRREMWRQARSRWDIEVVDYFNKQIGKQYNHCRFRNYKPVHESQKKAFDSVWKFLHSPPPPWCILLTGGAGTGKTHLLASAWWSWNRSLFSQKLKKDRYKFFQEREIPRYGYYWEFYQGLYWWNEADAELYWRKAHAKHHDGRYRGENLPTPAEFIDELMHVSPLFLDDFGMTSPTASAWHSAMNVVLCERHKTNRKTFISTNLSSKEIGELYGTHGERIVSRLSQGVCVKIEGPDGRLSGGW